MKFLITFALLVAVVSASPLIERRHPISKRSVTVLTPVEVIEATGPVVRRKARQFGGFGGFGGGGFGGGGYDNSNFGAYNQGGSFGGLGGFGSYDNSGFDYNQQQGFGGGGFGGYGGLGGFGF